MLVASLTDLVPMDYRCAFPQTSFAETGPSDDFLQSQGWARVNVHRPHDATTQRLVPCAPVLEDGWIYTVEVVDKTPEELDVQNAQLAIQVRRERNGLLAGCDWTQLADAPLSAEQRLAWVVYRQALRDITDQPEFPSNIVWPTAPA